MSSLLSHIFEDFGVALKEPRHRNYGEPVSVIAFPCGHHNDQEPLNLIAPGPDGPWIAGGACLRWYQGQPVGESDIDIFCRDEIQAQQVIDNIKSYGRFHTKYESDNALTLEYYTKSNAAAAERWTLQIIKRRYFKSLREVIDNFDISVCQVGTDGHQWMLGKDTARDIRERNLRMSLPLAPDAAKRLAKYWTYGYRPVEGLVDAVQTNPAGKKMFTMNEDYENAF
jgi:hypothetical protein